MCELTDEDSDGPQGRRHRLADPRGSADEGAVPQRASEAVPQAGQPRQAAEEDRLHRRHAEPRLRPARAPRRLPVAGQVSAGSHAERDHGGLRQGLANAETLADAATIVIYADGGGGHPMLPHLDEIEKLMQKGVGLACIHYAVEVPTGKPGDRLQSWIGGYFETFWSVNPEWKAVLGNCPITRWPTACGPLPSRMSGTITCVSWTT